MIVTAWLVAAVLVLAALAAAAATRVTALERPVRLAVTPLVVVLVVADLGLVLRADPADRPDSMLTHLGYAVASVGLVPMLLQRRPPAEGAEAEPASLWVVALALLAVAVCVVRLVQTR